MDWCVAANEPIYELSCLGLGTSCLGGLVGCCPLVEITFCGGVGGGGGGWLLDVLPVLLLGKCPPAWCLRSLGWQHVLVLDL